MQYRTKICHKKILIEFIPMQNFHTFIKIFEKKFFGRFFVENQFLLFFTLTPKIQSWPTFSTDHLGFAIARKGYATLQEL